MKQGGCRNFGIYTQCEAEALRQLNRLATYYRSVAVSGMGPISVCLALSGGLGLSCANPDAFSERAAGSKTLPARHRSLAQSFERYLSFQGSAVVREHQQRCFCL